jgi:hypothetical protein
MMLRQVVIILGVRILTTVTGCAVSPSQYETPPYGMYGYYGAYQGQSYGGGIDYEQKMDEEEREQELKYQQWEQERARERDPRWER